MSTYIEYDPAQFAVERATSLNDDGSGGGWVGVDYASFSMTSGYSVNDDGVLIVEAESATLTIAVWGAPWSSPRLYPTDLVRARYGTTVLFVGRVDSASHTTHIDADARKHGETRRTDFTVTLVGQHAAALGREVCWTYLPEEPSITRIRRWVTVNGWTGGDGTSPSEGG